MKKKRRNEEGVVPAYLYVVHLMFQYLNRSSLFHSFNSFSLSLDKNKLCLEVGRNVASLHKI